MKYIIAIGSNLQPGRHVPWVLKVMLNEFDTLVTGRFFRTEAYKMSSKYAFWNGAILIQTALNQAELKKRLCCWEEESGRNRGHPLCSVRDRTLDLDIVWHEELGWLDDLKNLKGLAYLWQPIASLLFLRRGHAHKLTPVWFVVHDKLCGGRRLTLKRP